jgi:protease-4
VLTLPQRNNKMKQFFKFMFASMLGTFVAVFALFFVFILIIAAAIGSAIGDLDNASKVTEVKDNSILKVDLNRPIVDRGPDQVFKLDFGPFSSVSPIGLDQIVENLEKAQTDDKIEGILLDATFPAVGMASLEEIRTALENFKASGKWIVSYGEMYSQSGYYLSSVADEIYVYPEGAIDFRGLSTNIAFLKGMFDKIGVEMQVIRGSNNKFKSAVEPFMYSEMSDANRLQTEKWITSLWNNMLSGISASREIEQGTLSSLANNYSIQTVDDAVNQKLVSAAKYSDEVEEILKQKTETESGEDLNFVTLQKYLNAPGKKDSGKFVPGYKKDKIAVIYASGNINSGEGNEEEIGSDTYAEALRTARLDTTVKAIVLRINSPGGSALASDVIWRETTLARAAKPLVVSMGDVAASGGYYIACGANKIFAMPGTITGSIGVFGLIPNMKGLFNDKMGITFDGVQTGEYASFPEVTRPLSKGEYGILQKSVDRTYGQFLEVVASGRGLSTAQVDSIGQGRVWSGVDALGIGLVDELGNLEDAIAAAAELAEIEDYTITKLPKRKDPFQALIDDLTGMGAQSLLRMQLGGDEALLEQFQYVQKVRKMEGVQAVLPYRLDVK